MAQGVLMHAVALTNSTLHRHNALVQRRQPRLPRSPARGGVKKHPGYTRHSKDSSGLGEAESRRLHCGDCPNVRSCIQDELASYKIHSQHAGVT
jgi:hypothetical protein